MFPKPPITGYRRLPNLRDLMTNAVIDFPTQQQEDRSIIAKISTRLGKCTYYPLLKKLTTVSCSYTEKQYKCINLPRKITCELSTIIYLITCSKCNMYCVGETSREFRKRSYEHRNSVLNPKPSRCTPVSRHFTQQNHKATHMEFSVLEWCTPYVGVPPHD